MELLRVEIELYRVAGAGTGAGVHPRDAARSEVVVDGRRVDRLVRDRLLDVLAENGARSDPVVEEALLPQLFAQIDDRP